MARRNLKRSKNNPARNVKCDLCGMQDPSGIPETRHRRCSGQRSALPADKPAPRRPKYAVNTGTRGLWK